MTAALLGYVWLTRGLLSLILCQLGWTRWFLMPWELKKNTVKQIKNS